MRCRRIVNGNIVWFGSIPEQLPPRKTLENTTWDELEAICHRGLHKSYFNIGDEKQVNIDGIDYTFVVADFDTYQITNSEKKSCITFMMKNLYKDKVNQQPEGSITLNNFNLKFDSRVTADGNIVEDEGLTTVHRIEGSTSIAYAKLSNAYFGGIVSTGRNVLKSLSTLYETKNGVTVSTNPYSGFVSVKGAANGWPYFTVAENIFLPAGTYTLYTYVVPSNSSITLNDADGKVVASANSSFTKFTTSVAKTCHLTFKVLLNTAQFNTSIKIMIFSGEVKYTSNFVAFEPYTADTSFAVKKSIELPKWDYIDVDNGKLVRQTVFKDSNTAFTDEELAEYDEYLISVDKKHIAYKSATKIETDIDIPKTYRVWTNGCEYVLKEGIDERVSQVNISFKLPDGTNVATRTITEGLANFTLPTNDEIQAALLIYNNKTEITSKYELTVDDVLGFYSIDSNGNFAVASAYINTIIKNDMTFYAIVTKALFNQNNSWPLYTYGVSFDGYRNAWTAGYYNPTSNSFTIYSKLDKTPNILNDSDTWSTGGVYLAGNQGFYTMVTTQNNSVSLIWRAIVNGNINVDLTYLGFPSWNYPDPVGGKADIAVAIAKNNIIVWPKAAKGKTISETWPFAGTSMNNWFYTQLQGKTGDMTQAYQDYCRDSNDSPSNIVVNAGDEIRIIFKYVSAAGIACFPAITYTNVYGNVDYDKADIATKFDEQYKTTFSTDSNFPVYTKLVNGEQATSVGNWSYVEYPASSISVNNMRTIDIVSNAQTDVDESFLTADGFYAWNECSAVRLFQNEYWDAAGSLSVQKNYVAGYQYKAEYDGTVKISFGAYKCIEYAGALALFVNHRMVWPNEGDYVYDVSKYASITTTLTTPQNLPTNVEVKKGDFIELLMRSTDADNWVVGITAMPMTVTYTSILDVDNISESGHQNSKYTILTVNQDYYIVPSGWKASYVRLKYFPKLLKKFDEDLASRILSVEIPSTIGQNLQMTSDTLFIPATFEYDASKGQDLQFEYYRTIKDGTKKADRVRYYNGQTQFYWTRESLIKKMYDANKSGDFIARSTTMLDYLPICFCFGEQTKVYTEFFNENDKHDNYADKQQGVADSLTQRLSVIKSELWYNVYYGLPLLDKLTSKFPLDAFVARTVQAHPDVVSILEFESKVVDRHYACSMIIVTKYGEIQLNI